jgi:Cu/Ag efflux pump CusA
VKTLDDVGNIVVKNRDGVPVLVKDIATVHFGYANRFGAITANGEGEKVFGQIMMLKNANSKEVIHDVKARVAEVQKTLPEGVFIIRCSNVVNSSARPRPRCSRTSSLVVSSSFWWCCSCWATCGRHWSSRR